MSDTYKLQYNANTITYSGFNGYVAFNDYLPKTDVYTLLWSGDARQNINLSQNWTAFDALYFCSKWQNIYVQTGVIDYFNSTTNNHGINTQIPFGKRYASDGTPYFSLRSHKEMFNTDKTTTSGTVNALSSWAGSFFANDNNRWNNNGAYFNWEKIYGVKYAI